MPRKRSSSIALLLLVATILVPTSIVLAEGAAQDGENLLSNPDFENNYVAHDEAGDIKVAPEWTPWYVEGDADEQADGYGRVPSYYWSSEGTDPGGVRTGELAQYFKFSWGTGAGGIYQVVDVPKNSKLRLSVYGRSFTCHPAEAEGPCVERDDAWVGMQIGIDPEGGTDFYADSVVFTDGIVGTGNEWQEFVLEANGTDSDEATVFIMFHPDFPRQETKVWWDDSELVVIGEAEAGSSSDDDGKKKDKEVLADFVTPQAPQADGSIVHKVKKGENLSSIAVAYYNQGYDDITVPRIKELNNLKGDIIIPGQKLTIVAAGGAAVPAAEATQEPAEEEGEEAEENEGGEEEAEAAEAAEEEVTPEPEAEEAEVADTSTGEICLSLFEDANSNTLQDPDELLLSGGTLTLASTTGAPENYTTDGVTEPHCFTSLAPGEYIASSTTPSGYTMTTVSSWSVQVDPGAQLELTFGAAFTGEESADTGEVDEETSGGGIFQNAGRVILGVSGLVVLLVAGGLAAYFLVFRRAA